MSRKFKPAQLPGNQYAFNSQAYLNPIVYDLYKKNNGGKEPMFVELKGFVLRA